MRASSILSEFVHPHIGQHVFGLFVHFFGIAGHIKDSAATPAPQGDHFSAAADFK